MARDFYAPRTTSWPWDQELPTFTLSRLWKLGAKAIGDARRGIARIFPEGHFAQTDDGFAAYLAICGLLDQAKLSDQHVTACLAHVLERAAVACSILDEDGENYTVDADRVEAIIRGVCEAALAGHAANKTLRATKLAVH